MHEDIIARACKDEKFVARFWAKVRKTDGCWEWARGRDGKGYGAASIDGVQIRASRIAWCIQNGRLPTGKWVLHECDNPPCCRPEHLFIGGATENNADARAKGRSVHACFENNGSGKITRADMDDIRISVARGESYRQIAARLGVHKSAIGQHVKLDRLGRYDLPSHCRPPKAS